MMGMGGPPGGMPGYGQGDVTVAVCVLPPTSPPLLLPVRASRWPVRRRWSARLGSLREVDARPACGSLHGTTSR